MIEPPNARGCGRLFDSGVTQWHCAIFEPVWCAGCAEQRDSCHAVGALRLYLAVRVASTSACWQGKKMHCAYAVPLVPRVRVSYTCWQE